MKMSTDNMIKIVENCVRGGVPLIIEDVQEHLEPMLEPLLLKHFTFTNRRKIIRLGDNEMEFDENFRLFFSTKLANPHYLPEIFIRVITLILNIL